MNLKEIESLIKFVSKSGVSEVELETKDVKITIKTENGRPAEVQSVITQMPMQAQMPNMQMAPVNMGNQAPAAPQEAPKAEAPKADDSKLITVKSPMIGTFYRSSSPDKPAFINVGDSIKPGDVVTEPLVDGGTYTFVSLKDEVVNDLPARIGYSLEAAGLNPTGYESGKAALGGSDNMATKLWWDVN